MLAKLWANQITEGKKTYDEVPEKLKEWVMEILVGSGSPELVLG